jgi:hypothetical protein
MIAVIADKCEGRPALALEFPAFPAITLVLRLRSVV